MVGFYSKIIIVWHNRHHDILPLFSNQSFSDPREKGLTFEPISHQFDISIRPLCRRPKKIKPTMTEINRQQVMRALYGPRILSYSLMIVNLARSTIDSPLFPLGVSSKKRCNIQRPTNKRRSPGGYPYG